MDEQRMRALVADARVARLATLGPDGRPHLVPFVFALEGDTLYTTVDRKPKRSAALQRVRNIERDPRVSVLVDRYDEDWTELWWVRMDGRARLLNDGPTCEHARALLRGTYAQYEEDLDDELIIAIDVERWVGWAYRD